MERRKSLKKTKNGWTEFFEENPSMNAVYPDESRYVLELSVLKKEMLNSLTGKRTDCQRKFYAWKHYGKRSRIFDNR